jgi:hypothetical protein
MLLDCLRKSNIKNTIVDIDLAKNVIPVRVVIDRKIASNEKLRADKFMQWWQKIDKNYALASLYPIN